MQIRARILEGHSLSLSFLCGHLDMSVRNRINRACDAIRMQVAICELVSHLLHMNEVKLYRCTRVLVIPT
jgi:hypothetical protein